MGSKKLFARYGPYIKIKRCWGDSTAFMAGARDGVHPGSCKNKDNHEIYLICKINEQELKK
jgi:hypothetical protein